MSFEEFFATEQRRLVKLCYLLLLDRAAGEEVAQEVMAEVWRNWDRLDTSYSPYPWAVRVAVRRCRNRQRRRLLEMRRAPLFATDAVTAGPNGDLVDLHHALRRLPARQREAVALHYWADLPVAGCAEAMGISAGAVKQHLDRARRHLRQFLSFDQEVVHDAR